MIMGMLCTIPPNMHVEVCRRDVIGGRVLVVPRTTGKHCLAGTGATPEGNRPFLDLLDVGTGETRRLWQSSPPFFEYTLNLLNDLDDAPIRWHCTPLELWIIVDVTRQLIVFPGRLCGHALRAATCDCCAGWLSAAKIVCKPYTCLQEL